MKQMTTVETMTMMKIRPMKYSLGMSLLLPPPASVFPSSSSPAVSAWLELKVRTLSAVREAARGQVRMELKAAPAVLTVRSQVSGGEYFKPINPREKMTTPVVPRNSDMKSPSWLMEKLSVDPSWWKPEPTMRMRMETETAEVVEKAMPLWAEASCLP